MYAAKYIKAKIITLMIVLLLSSCIPENPFLSQEDIQELQEEAEVNSRGAEVNIAMIINNEVYYISGEYTSAAKQLTYDGLTKTCVKLSSDKNLIAYLDEESHVHIINVENGTDEEVVNDKAYEQIGWTDSASLFLFEGEDLSFYGNEYPVPDMTDSYTSSSSYIRSACINENGEYAYIVNTPYASTQKLVIGNSEESRVIDYGEDEYDFLISVYFNANRELCVLSYSDIYGFKYDDIAIIPDVPAFITDTDLYLSNYFEDFIYRSYVYYDKTPLEYYVEARIVSSYYQITITDYSEYGDAYDEDYIIDTISTSNHLYMDVR